MTKREAIMMAKSFLGFLLYIIENAMEVFPEDFYKEKIEGEMFEKICDIILCITADIKSDTTEEKTKFIKNFFISRGDIN